MPKIVKKMLNYLCLLLILVASGCSPADKDNPSTATNQAQKKTDHTNSDTKKRENGTVASFKKIKVSGLQPSLQAYEMMYWSERVKTAAYVTVPKKGDAYFLSVICHGGYVFPDDSEGVQSVGDVLLGESLLQNVSSDHINLVPLYRGYGDSMGKVSGLYGATVDTNNAIDAL